jgi:methyltransferase-like protein
MEQYMDFLRNRMFRQTLLCHEGTKLDYTLRPDAVEKFRVVAQVKPLSKDDAVPLEPTSPAEAPEAFGAPGKATLTTSDPLMKAAMHCLSDAEPLPLPFDALLAAARARLGRDQNAAAADERRQLATRLLNCYLSGLVDFGVSAPPFVGAASERPVASPYARLRAREGGKVVNLRLENVVLTAPSRLVLQHLDGTHDRAALVDLVAQWLRTAPASSAAPDALVVPPAPGPTGAAPAAASAGANPAPDPEHPPEARAAAYVDALLGAFARGALLVA